jgi:hypothetical protein
MKRENKEGKRRKEKGGRKKEKENLTLSPFSFILSP